MTHPSQTTQNTANAIIGLLACGLILIGFAGCGSKSNSPSAAPADPLKAMRTASRKGQWSEAWKYADQVLAEHGDDTTVLMMVAKAAHSNGKGSRAADLLAEACRSEDFAQSSRVQQMIIGMISVGRFYDGLEVLEEAVKKQPDQHETRRALYDFYMGSENRFAGLPHGRYLVRQRKFDFELLKALSNTERRSMDAKPLEEMTQRNPNDKRPLLGRAKIKFDERDYAGAIEMLNSIIDAHPEYLPAQDLMAKTLAAAGEFEELETWVATASDQLQSQGGYWIAMGDWARSKQQFDEAARAYWEATKRDPDVMESWSKLSAALKQVDPAKLDVDRSLIEGIDRRAALLSKFNQQKNRFIRTGEISRETVVQIVGTLQELGRLWEAEAWAVLAATLPEDDSVSVEEARSDVVAMLQQDTPWQITKNIPEFQIDLTSLAAPSISSIAVAKQIDSQSPNTQAGDVGGIKLINEAKARGITYFGRTSDNLNQPGIMLHETLGCGGGTIDFDLDGWSDLYLIGAGGKPPKFDSQPNELMRNLAGKFTSTTVASHTGDKGFGQGVAVGDINEDGFPDMLVLNYGPNTLLVNNGDGTFRDASESLPNNSESTTWSTSAAIADINDDGISDLVIVNYCDGLEPSTKTCPMKGSEIFRACTPVMFPAAPDSFLQSNGDGSFTDRTDDWGVQPAVLGRGLGIVAGSFDQRNGVDVFIANDMTNNHFWSRSLDDDKFGLSESAMLRGLGADDRSLAQGSMGIATGDMDRDGDLDFYVTNFDKEYNTYHEQQSAGTWQDRTSAQRLIQPTMPFVGFGTEAIDIDNDGVLELVVTNGHVDMFSRGEERSVYAHPMQIFRRNENKVFASIENHVGGDYLSTPHVGRALWTIDANRDGKTDLVVTHQTEPVALLINRSQTSGNWIGLKLCGRTCARDAVGSSINIRSDRHNWTTTVSSGDGYLCSNERIIRIGVGSETKKCDVKVTWPDGSETELQGIETGDDWIVTQGDKSPFLAPPPSR